MVENKPLKTWIRDQTAKKAQNAVIQAPPMGSELEGLVNAREKWSPYIPEEHFFDQYDDETFQDIMEQQMSVIKLLKKHGKMKTLANRILIIFDDLVGSTLFAGSRGAYFKGVNTRHRHYSASFMMVSQGYKEIPKTIRSNWSCLIVFEIGNEREVQVIYEEYAMGLGRDQWLESYKFATNEDHSFMFINFQRQKRLRIMKNFSSYIFHKEEE